MAATSLICSGTVSRVSSVLNRDVKQFGKKFMFDGNEETCWNSDQGATQWLTLEFPQAVRASQVQIQFQGGFASQKCVVQGCQNGGDLSPVAEFYPEDTNSLQISFFPFPPSSLGRAGVGDGVQNFVFLNCSSLYHFSLEETPLNKLKITFENSTDFFGRVIVYQLDVRGVKL
uniref:Nuclear receptor 2C2 associated protein n=1 Tax=Podarcis muralis TaxID=64176 RepID=A0A670K786_PODMU